MQICLPCASKWRCALGVFKQPLTLILLQKYRNANGSRVVIEIGGVYSTFCKRRAYFCTSIAIEMGGASWCFSKVSGSEVDLTLLSAIFCALRRTMVRNLSMQPLRGPVSTMAARTRDRKTHTHTHILLGNGPNTVSGSTVSNTELSEFFGAHWAPGSELSEFLSAYYLCAKRTHRVFLRTHRVCPKTQWVLFSETVLPKPYSGRFPISRGPLNGDLHPPWRS